MNGIVQRLREMLDGQIESGRLADGSVQVHIAHANGEWTGVRADRPSSSRVLRFIYDMAKQQESDRGLANGISRKVSPDGSPVKIPGLSIYPVSHALLRVLRAAVILGMLCRPASTARIVNCHR